MANQAVLTTTLTYCMSNKLENLLHSKGASSQDIEKAKAYREKYGGNLEKLLVNLGALSEDDLPAIYSEYLDLELLESIESSFTFPDTELMSVNVDFLNRRHWYLLEIEGQQPCFVTTDPLNWEVQQYLSSHDIDYELKVCSQGLLEQLQRSKSQQEDMPSYSDDLNTLSEMEEDKIRELASEAPTVNLLNSLISKGLKLGASDMHVEPVDGRCRVRYRIDGVLHDSETIPKRLQLPITSRLKILSGMDIAEKRRPQDGKIEIKIANTELDIRVSSLPLNDGESIVLRFLKKDAIKYDMDVLGISADIKNLLVEDLTATAGVVLMTGPTGSGKTTTLYTFLNELNNDDVKIITLEDPVEYQLDGVNQVQVNSEIGFDFSAGLRSIVRQDPDIIMLGEIRDKETASIAMQSALTGHLVFSTVHTNDAPSAFTRLLDLGVEEFLLNAAIVSIVAQRLARKLCDECKVPHPEADSLIAKYNLHSLVKNDIHLCMAKGCDSCANTGYKGRTAVIEYLRCDEDLKNLNKDHTFIQEAKALNAQKGRRTLLQDGLLKASLGVTTIDEIIRVAG